MKEMKMTKVIPRAAGTSYGKFYSDEIHGNASILTFSLSHCLMHRRYLGDLFEDHSSINFGAPQYYQKYAPLYEKA